jgi:CRISPR system Cascade subunit CasE
VIYLSLLRLNPRSHRAIADLRNPYDLHRTLSRAFGAEEADYRAARCLFRLEEGRDGLPVLLVQACRTPDWATFSATDYLLATPEVKSAEPVLRPGIRLRFRLRANPTKRLSAGCPGEKKDGKRVQLFKEEEQLAWLARKGEAGGFHVQEACVSARGNDRARKEGHTLTFGGVLFDGVLEVTDPDAFVRTLEAGVGTGKGFGYGLLSVARV